MDEQSHAQTIVYKDVWLVGGARTPFADYNGTLREVSATDLGIKAAREALVAGLARHNVAAQGSSMRIGRCLLLTEPPSIDASEITDKGYLNQRAVLTKRAALVDQLHGRPAAANVIVIA